MNDSYYSMSGEINLHVAGRVSQEDAERQLRTAEEILRRLGNQPGVILADEVGMGKTFVALAVGVSVALQNPSGHPVVVMVPPSLKEKWPRDFNLFRECCLPEDIRDRITAGSASRAVEFLKLLDDPPSRRKSMIFVTHGAMSRGLSDKWVKLATIAQALKHRNDASSLRKGLSRILSELLRMGKFERQAANGQALWRELTKKHPSCWLEILQKRGVDPEADNDISTDDDPVPEAVWKALEQMKLDDVYESLQEIPLRRSKYFDARLKQARESVNRSLRETWKECVTSLRLQLPLLILDEAHHLKNAQTKLASLFQVEEARDDAEEFTRGPLAQTFERMLFLTATPFQLGHGELCSVLDRFGSIRWKGRHRLEMSRKEYEEKLRNLRSSLDAAQESALRFEDSWGKLSKDDSIPGPGTQIDVGKWWKDIDLEENHSPWVNSALRSYRQTHTRLKESEKLLKPWVIRHLKPRQMNCNDTEVPRRERILGKSIIEDEVYPNDEGISIEGESLLPFLLGARTVCYSPTSRPVFAEGLASSYEAFLQTRRLNLQSKGRSNDPLIDYDDQLADRVCIEKASEWYLNRLESILPQGDAASSLSHPKIRATVERTKELWKAGEKVVVFCHYVATGRTLRQRISESIRWEIIEMGRRRLHCAANEVEQELERIGRRFFVEDSPVRRACAKKVSSIVEDFPGLRDLKESLHDIVLRNVRTPFFLVRYFPIQREGRLTEEDMITAFKKQDKSGLTLEALVRDFFRFLDERCSSDERYAYIDALSSIQTGSYKADDVPRSYSPDELQGGQVEHLLPNVRLVNGSTRSETRQRLLLTFNTPFYPEVLVASSVMAEGVDLHLYCRHIIHHDLSWNPSTLEQRTGRLDRIGAKIERCCQPLRVYIPYIMETQDERMYRVVMDREKWFKVVMGEDYNVDSRTTEEISRRLPLPEAIVEELTFHLEV